MILQSLVRRVTYWQRQSMALLMLLLHVGVALAPLAEREGRHAANHAEQRGTRHARMHNERTCAVCTVRSLQTAVSAAGIAPTVHDAPFQIIIAFVDAVFARPAPTLNSSRAPPSMS